MSEKVDFEFEVDHLGVTEETSFSQLLYQVEHDVVGLQMNDHHHLHQTPIFNSTNTSSSSSLYSPTTDLESPKMLCCGDFQNNNTLQVGFSCSSDSSSPSSTTINSTKLTSSSSSKSTNVKKRNVVLQEKVQCEKNNTEANHRSSKKPKTEKPSAGKKREKLGERISALQQLVSPFGKTDTASVLHEALGYIRFLHNQVLVLCSPYLQGLPSLPLTEGELVTERKGSTTSNLRSQGLCLVPMEYMAENNNGADYWSSVATMGTNNNHNVS